MERLTYRDSDGRAHLTTLGARMYCSVQATADYIAKLEEILTAYKDTGLEPEEINDYLPMLKEWRQNMGALRHVHELVKSEAEGRLVVLPCKVGDTVYCIRKNPFAKGRYVKENIAESITVYRDHSFSIFSTLNDVLGQTVFLTREEAEATIKKYES